LGGSGEDHLEGGSSVDNLYGGDNNDKPGVAPAATC
jgi:hypothetical protein